MKPIMLEDLCAVLAELNERYPRPGMASLSFGDLLDVRDADAAWPDAGKPGIYAMFGEDRSLLYLGKASCNSNLGRRLGAHFDRLGASRGPKFTKVRYVATVGLPPDRAFEAPAVEEFLIARLNPALCSIARSEPLPMQDAAEQGAAPDTAGLA